MAETWRLIRSGHVTGAQNMAIDEAMIRSVAAGERPTLRLYGWEPPAVSVGYFQDLEREVDEAACNQLGIDVVRRLTGGRAVLHDVEVTYSLLIPENHPLIPSSVVESYRVISEGMMRGLERLGLKPEMTMPQRSPNGGVRRPDEGGSAACFDAPSWYEVTIGGKKVIGSAQVRKYGIVLQHGSIPLQLDADKLFSVLRFPNDAVRERAKASFLQKADSIRSVLRRPISFLELCDHLIAGMEERLDVRFEEAQLTPEEEADAQHLASSRYSQPEWNRTRGHRSDDIVTIRRTVSP